MPQPPSRFKVSACTAEHIGDRADQQDRVTILTSPHHPGALLAVLADGMGGRTGGRLASDQVVATAQTLFAGRREAGMTPVSLLERIATEAHTVVRLTALSAEKEPHSTLVALYLDREHAHWVHAGDSRLYHFRDGRLVNRTTDHNYGTQLTASGRVDRNHPSVRKLRNVLYSAIGIGKQLRLDQGGCDDLAAGDAFLLASDGLWAYFPDDELGAMLRDASASDCARALVARARERGRGRGDNLSLAIVKLDPPSLDRPVRPARPAL